METETKIETEKETKIEKESKADLHTKNDTITNLTKAQILWQCRRGMLELDILLSAFCENQYEHLMTNQKHFFVELLAYSDQELFDWLLGKSDPQNPDLLSIVQMMRK